MEVSSLAVTARGNSSAGKPQHAWASVRSIPIEVNPVQGDRLRVALEQRLRQRNLEVPVLERKLLGRLAVTADDADVRPEGAFLVQRGVLLAFGGLRCRAGRCYDNLGSAASCLSNTT